MWTTSKPGGPAEPFWGVVSQTGEVIVLQAGSKERAELIASLGGILEMDFDTVHAAGRRLRAIVERDGVGMAVDKGSDDYVVRAVIEALFGNEAG